MHMLCYSCTNTANYSNKTRKHPQVTFAKISVRSYKDPTNPPLYDENCCFSLAILECRCIENKQSIFFLLDPPKKFVDSIDSTVLCHQRFKCYVQFKTRCNLKEKFIEQYVHLRKSLLQTEPFCSTITKNCNHLTEFHPFVSDCFTFYCSIYHTIYSLTSLYFMI